MLCYSDIFHDLAQTAHKVFKEYDGHHGSTQVPLGLLLIPMITRILRSIIRGILQTLVGGLWQWASFRFYDYVSPTAYVENTDEAFGWIMAYLTQDPDARKQMHHFQLSSADRQANKKAKNAVESKMEKSASWRTLQVIAKVQRTYGRLIRIKHKGATLWIKRKLNGFARGNIAKEHIRDAKQGQSSP